MSVCSGVMTHDMATMEARGTDVLLPAPVAAYASPDMCCPSLRHVRVLMRCGVLALTAGQFRDHEGVAPRSPSCQVMSKYHLMPGWVGHPDVTYANA